MEVLNISSKYEYNDVEKETGILLKYWEDAKNKKDIKASNRPWYMEDLHAYDNVLRFLIKRIHYLKNKQKLYRKNHPEDFI